MYVLSSKVYFFKKKIKYCFVCVCTQLLSHVQLSTTLWTVAHLDLPFLPYIRAHKDLNLFIKPKWSG